MKNSSWINMICEKIKWHQTQPNISHQYKMCINTNHKHWPNQRNQLYSLRIKHPPATTVHDISFHLHPIIFIPVLYLQWIVQTSIIIFIVALVVQTIRNKYSIYIAHAKRLQAIGIKKCMRKRFCEYSPKFIKQCVEILDCIETRRFENKQRF